MEYYYDAVDLLKGMISRASFSREENVVTDYLQQAWEKAGHQVHRKGNNLWIIAPDYDDNKPSLLLNSHIDTVRPVDGWTRDPFTPQEEEDRLYGLGSNDAGASVVSLYAAYTLLIRQPQPYNFVFLASCEEEVSGKGGIESVLQEPLFQSSNWFAVVGEPTNMNPAIAEKGLMVVDCVSHGRSGHAARDEGENAILLALREIEWISRYRFPKESPLLGAVKMSVTMIHAGTQHNVIPDKCEFTIDIRVNECYTNEEVYQTLKENLRCDVKARSFRLNSSHTPVHYPIVERAKMLGKMPFGSPTLSDQALIPFPSVKIGPGDSARSHSADEYINLAEIREAIDLYVNLLNGLPL